MISMKLTQQMNREHLPHTEATFCCVKKDDIIKIQVTEQTIAYHCYI